MCETPLAEGSKSPTTVPEKKLGVLTEDLVGREAFFKSPATAPQKKLDDVDDTFTGEPQEEGMMQYRSSFPLITKPRLSNPVGLGEGLARCQRRRLQQLTWTCT